jgi:hypothetical protein
VLLTIAGYRALGTAGAAKYLEAIKRAIGEWTVRYCLNGPGFIPVSPSTRRTSPEASFFPPVTVWFDETDHWLTEGFQRTAATERAGQDRIAAEIHHGTMSEAQRHSYAANASHALRRTGPETHVVVRLALQHPKAASLPDVQLARYLHIPETTLRRWRKRLSSPRGDDSLRVVTRGKSTYSLRTGGINKSQRGHRAKTRTDLRRELEEMKERSSPNARRLLNIIGHWALGTAGAPQSLEAIERVVRDWTG